MGCWKICLISDHVNDTFKIFKYISIPKPDNTVAQSLKLSSARFVVGEVLSLIVLPAIKFHNQLATMTGKVGNKPTNWHLPTKVPVCVLEKPKLLPQFLFRISNIAAKFTCELIGH